MAISWLFGILFIVVTGMVVAKFVMSAPAYFIILASISVALGLVLVRNIQVGIFCYFCIAAFAFGESPGVQSPNSSYKAGLMPSEVLLAFLVMIWLTKMVLALGRKPVKAAVNAPLIALWCVSFASMLMSNLLRGTKEQLFHQLLITQVAEVGLLLCSIMAFFLVSNGLTDRKWVSATFVPVVALGMYYAAHRILEVPLPIGIMWGALLISAAIAFVLSRLLFDHLGRGKKVFFSILLLMLIYSAFKDLSWISGWIAATVVLVVVTYFRSKPAAVVVVFIGLFALFVYPGVYNGVQTESEQGGDYDRFTIWRDATAMFMEVNPVLGVGPGNYNAYIYFHSSVWYGENTYTTAHSNYVQIATETGLLGFAAFILVLISAIITGVQSARGSPPELRWLGVAATAVFAGIAVASLFGDYLFPSRGNNGIVNFGTTVYTWLILGAAVAAANLPRKPETEALSQ